MEQERPTGTDDSAGIRSPFRRRIAAIVAGASLLVLVSALTVWHLPAPAPTLLIASGPAGDVSFQIGEVLATILEDAFPGFPEGKDLDFANTPSGGSVDNVLRVFNGRAHLGLAEEGIELDQKTIRTSGGSPSITSGQPQAEARTLVQLFSSPLKVVARRDLGRQAGVAPPPLRMLSDLGRLTDRRRTQHLPPFKISIGTAGSGTRKVAMLVLDQYGLTASPDPSREDGADFAIRGHDWTIERVRRGLLQGEIDIAFFLTAFGTGELRNLALQGGFVLLGIDRAEGIHRSHPFLDVVRIPTASYPSSGKFPETDIETLAAGEILIGSSLLTDQQAYRIVESIFNHSHNLGSAFPFMPPLSKADQLAERSTTRLIPAPRRSIRDATNRRDSSISCNATATRCSASRGCSRFAAQAGPSITSGRAAGEAVPCCIACTMPRRRSTSMSWSRRCPISTPRERSIATPTNA
jgi:TRAP-type uncharacterized transport system substrate-binding protein